PSDYSFRLARLIADDEVELDELRQSLLTRQPETVARLLQTHHEWENEDETLIEDIVRGNDTTDAEKAAIWTALEKLVGAPGSMRAYRLGEAMFFAGDMERATPLLLGVLKDGVAINYVDKQSVLLEIVTAYCQKGDWQAAEDLLTKNNDWAWSSITTGLGHVALAAAQHDSPEDAIRLWRIRANLDRNDLSGLDQLAKTGARKSLLDFYLQMKKVDPAATVAESALAILK
ncbi:MAG TPA: hypothetical protein VGN86_13290, partial [Pyrinomonadaceae bacterium]|nr:hypothetical protein [Pyrinomonadaceae bacterium]